MRRRIAALSLVLVLVASIAGALDLPPLPDGIPPAVAKMNSALAGLLAPLKENRTALLKQAESFDRTCGHVAAGSALDVQCGKDFGLLSAIARLHKEGSEAFLKLYAKAVQDAVDEARLIKSMNTLAQRLGWSDAERKTLDLALNSLSSDGSGTSPDAVKAWSAVLARGQDAAFKAAAAKGAGPGLYDSGAQGRLEDCAVFALATAAGVPYGVAAARATKLIAEGDWRTAAERADPQKTIERGGLTGGEVIMLATAFGEARVVKSETFAATLKAGRPIMVGLVPPNGDFTKGHETVLSKTFQHGGDTWFEMIDSNQGTQRRLYVSKTELGAMLKENGVTYQPKPHKLVP